MNALNYEGNILDIGAGVSDFFLNLYKTILTSKIKIYLLEPSPMEILALQNIKQRTFKNFKNNVFIKSITAEEMKFPKDYFDIIILSESYYHLKDIHKVFTNIKLSLKNNGILLIKNSREKEERSNDQLSQNVMFQTHLRNDSHYQLIDFLKNIGFRVIDVFYDENDSHSTIVIKAKKVKKIRWINNIQI